MNNGKVKGTPGNVVLIDLDDDNVVIIDDTAESSQPKYRTSNVPREHGSSSVEGVINIDDDEDSSVEPIPRPDGDGDLVSDASSSKSQFPAYKTARNSANLGTGKCEVREKTSAFQFSKCKQTYRTTATGRNRYGLDPASDDGSTDIDCSDCEIMEDSFGKLREQWERASLRRKHGGQNRHSGFEDQGSASESNYEARTNAGEEKGKEQHPEVPVSSSSGNADYGKENPPEFVTSDGAHMETFSKPQSESLFVDADQKVEQEKPASEQESESFERYTDFQPGGGSVAGHPRCSYDRHTCEDAYDGIPGYWNNEPSPQESFKPKGGPTAKDHYCCNECKSYQDVCDGIPMFCKEKEPSPRSSFMSFEQEVGDKQQTHRRPSSREKENLDSGRSSLPKSSLFDEMEIGDETEDILIFHTVVEANSEGTSGKASYPNKVRADSDDASLCTRAQDRQDTNQNESSSAGEKGLEDNSELLRAKDGLVIPSSKSCIINERENLKGTEEYKRAIEEEWASRQRELRIQVWLFYTIILSTPMHFVCFIAVDFFNIQFDICYIFSTVEKVILRSC